jgi:hypothetical protein
LTEIFSLTERVVPVGRPVRHRRFGWAGVVSRFAHQDGQVMVLWTEYNGASLAAYDDLEVGYVSESFGVCGLRDDGA